MYKDKPHGQVRRQVAGVNLQAQVAVTAAPEPLALRQRDQRLVAPADQEHVVHAGGKLLACRRCGIANEHMCWMHVVAKQLPQK